MLTREQVTEWQRYFGRMTIPPDTVEMETCVEVPPERGLALCKGWLRLEEENERLRAILQRAVATSHNCWEAEARALLRLEAPDD